MLTQKNKSFIEIISNNIYNIKEIENYGKKRMEI